MDTSNSTTPALPEVMAPAVVSVASGFTLTEEKSCSGVMWIKEVTDTDLESVTVSVIPDTADSTGWAFNVSVLALASCASSISSTSGLDVLVVYGGTPPVIAIDCVADEARLMLAEDSFNAVVVELAAGSIATFAVAVLPVESLTVIVTLTACVTIAAVRLRSAE